MDEQAQNKDPVSLNKIIVPVDQSLSTRRSDEQYQKRVHDERRYFREKSVNETHRVIKAVIPMMFWAAHLRGLNKEFCERLLNFDGRVGLILCGPVGTGKSWTMAALMRRFISSSQKCERVGWEALCIKIRSTYSKDSMETEDSILQRLLKPRHLFIEDIGAGKAVDAPETDFAKRILYVLIDTRLENGLPTYITTNKTREQLAATFDERIASRLSAFKWIAVGGKDKRKENA
jgi:DNA replication protein DnaC